MDDSSFRSLLKRKKETELIQKEDYKRKSRERLFNISSKKIQTTMIGALETIEKIFGFLWENDSNMKELFDKARSEILDRGNNQIRNLQTEVEQYEVEWKRYHITLPVRPLFGLIRRDNEQENRS